MDEVTVCVVEPQEVVSSDFCLGFTRSVGEFRFCSRKACESDVARWVGLEDGRPHDVSRSLCSYDYSGGGRGDSQSEAVVKGLCKLVPPSVPCYAADDSGQTPFQNPAHYLLIPKTDVRARKMEEDVEKCLEELLSTQEWSLQGDPCVPFHEGFQVAHQRL